MHDLAREGSLRFLDPDQPAEAGFLSQSSQVPPIVQLPKLIHASKEVANESGGLEEVKLLLEMQRARYQLDGTAVHEEDPGIARRIQITS